MAEDQHDSHGDDGERRPQQPAGVAAGLVPLIHPIANGPAKPARLPTELITATNIDRNWEILLLPLIHA